MNPKLPHIIKAIRSELSLSQEEFGKLIGVAGKSTVSNWEIGKSVPERDHLIKLSDLGNIPIGDFFTEPRKDRSLILNPEINHFAPQREYRILGSIPAGRQGEVIIHDYITTEVIDLDPNNTDLLLIDEEFGYSMTPLMKPGDIVAIDYRSKVYNGCIVAAKWDKTKGAVKILSINESDPTWVTLLSYNMAIPPISVKRNKVVMYHVFWWIDRARLKKKIK